MPGVFGKVFERSSHSYLRLVLLVSTPAIIWLGLFGIIGAARLGSVDQSHLLMSTNQAVLLCACGGLLTMARVFSRFKNILALMVIALSGFGWVSSSLWAEWQSQRFGLTEFALILSTLSGLGMLVVRPVGGPLSFRPGRSSLATAIIGTFFSVAAAYVLIERDVVQIQERAQSRVEKLRDSVTTSVFSSVGAIERLAARWSTMEQSIPAMFVQQEFNSMVAGFDEFKRLTYMDAASLSPRHDTIADAKYSGLLEQAMTADAFKNYLKRVLESGQVHLSPVGVFLPDPKTGFIVAAIFSGDLPQRIVVATVDIPLLAGGRLEESEFECCYEISSNDHIILNEPMTEDQRALAIATDSASLHQDVDLRFRYWHVDASTRIEQPFLPEGILLFGLAFTFLANSSQRLTHAVRRRNLQLQHSALHDALTGLPNRRMLIQEMQRAKTQCERDGSSLSVVFLELDGLRLISDSLGHEAADKLLIETALRLRKQLPVGTSLARLDSGDFVVCIAGLTQQEVESLTRKLLSLAQEPLQVDSNQLRVTAFAGIARTVGPHIDPMQMVRQADMAMLKARRSGYAAWRHYTPELGEQVNARLSLFNDLQTAMERGSIQLRYQPLVDGRSGSVVSFEVLMRLPHPVLGEISPGVFIPMAEESGQILPLTDWLLSKACQDAKQLQTSGYADAPVAVNISPRYFQMANFVEKVRTALLVSGLAPSRLHLEITESVLLDDAGAAITKLQQLRDLGVEAALDDFGTGYSSLAYLRQLPIAAIKIDRTFVRNVVSEPTDAAIVRGVIAMAHHLHLKVVAEGIETVPQFSFLQRSGCDFFQGYLFDRPRLLEDILAEKADTAGRRTLPKIGTPFGTPPGSRPFSVLLAGSTSVSRPFVEMLADATGVLPDDSDGETLAVACTDHNLRLRQVSTGAQTLAWLAQNDVDLVIVQDGLTDMGVRSLLTKVADIHPDLLRWLSRAPSSGSYALDEGLSAPGGLAHRVWQAQQQEMSEMIQAVLEAARR